MKEELGRLPVDLDAEKATLGSLLLDREAILAINAWLRPGHFYLQKHADIYSAMLKMCEKRIPIDIATLASALRDANQLDSLGGMAALAELANAVPTAVHVEHYAHAVEKAHLRRSIIEIGGKISALGYSDDDDMSEKAERLLFGVTHAQALGSFSSLSDIMSSYFDTMTENQDRPHTGLQSAIPDLDDLTGGFHKSDLVIIAARPSIGKTSLALSIARNIAKSGKKVGFLSLEMSSQQLGQKLLAIESGVDLQSIRSGKIDDISVVVAAMARLSELSLFIDDTPNMSMLSIRAKARRLIANEGIDILFVDYLQLIGNDRRFGNETEAITEISKSLKSLARELNIPVVALSQLSRQIESRTDNTPKLSDMRGSGSIEQDADIIIAPTRIIGGSEATLHILKQRNGPIGTCDVVFDCKTTEYKAAPFRYNAVEGY